MSLTIRYKGTNPSDKVQVAGEFNGWVPTDMKSVGEAEWQSTFTDDISEGQTYQYKFIINDQWGLDPNAESTDDGSGNLNHVVTATSVPVATQAAAEPTVAAVDKDIGTAASEPEKVPKAEPETVPEAPAAIESKVESKVEPKVEPKTVPEPSPEARPVDPVTTPQTTTTTATPATVTKAPSSEPATAAAVSNGGSTAQSKVEPKVEPKTSGIVKPEEPKTTKAPIAEPKPDQVPPKEDVKPEIAAAATGSVPSTVSGSSGTTGSTAVPSPEIGKDHVQTLRTPDRKKKRGFFKRIFG